MSKTQKRKLSYPIIALLILVLFPILISTYLRSKNQDLKPNKNSTQNSQATQATQPTPTTPNYSYTKGVTYQGQGYTVDQVKGWENLKSNCQKISITKSNTEGLSLTMNEYILKRMGFRDIQTFNEVINSRKTASNEHAFEFKNIPSEDLLFFGPDGEGDLNNIFIRGPQGYYHAHVTYSGSVLGDNKMCLTDSARNEYKYILSTFTFTK